MNPGVAVVGTILAIVSGCARPHHAQSEPPLPTPALSQAPFPATSTAPLQSVAPCPAGAPLGPGQGIVIDYVDFVEVGDTTFLRALDAGSSGFRPPRLGPVVARVRCLLSGLPYDRSEPPLVDGTAAYLPVGTELHSVEGFPAGCRLAAVVGTTVLFYLAQPPEMAAQKRTACAVGTPTASTW